MISSGKNPPGRILVAIDDSPYASAVMEKAAKLAYSTGSDVTILSVVPMPKLVASEGEINSVTIGEEDRNLVSLQKNLMDKFFAEPGILIESKILHGDPADKICEYAERMQADMIVVGSRGRSKLTAALLGSVSGKIAHNCKCSVLIVKRSKQT